MTKVTASVTVEVEAVTQDGLVTAAIMKIAEGSPSDWTFTIEDDDDGSIQEPSA